MTIKIDCIGCLHGEKPTLDKDKILIPGNHDGFLRDNPNFYSKTNIKYLCESITICNQLKVYGTPWTPWFPGINPHCASFTYKTESEGFNHWDKIPHDVDILITHGPAKGILDNNFGSMGMYAWLKYVGRPMLHVFSHIHEGYGQAEVFPGKNDTMVKYVNCSHVDQYYDSINKPIRVEL